MHDAKALTYTVGVLRLAARSPFPDLDHAKTEHSSKVRGPGTGYSSRMSGIPSVSRFDPYPSLSSRSGCRSHIVSVLMENSTAGGLVAAESGEHARIAASRTTSVQRAGAILQEAGTSLILREAFFGVRRFDDFQRNLAMSRSVLARRLKSLVDRGIMDVGSIRIAPTGSSTG